MADSSWPTAPIKLQAGDARCELWPALGGSIGRWAIGRQEMLRRAGAAALANARPVGMATFPLVPYSNRIGFGRFIWKGEAHQLSLNFPPEPHAIHGTGWSAVWQAEQVDATSANLRYAHGPDANWPWPFEAEQRVTLSANALLIELTARNLSDKTVPLAFGHHPYFDSEGATLSFSAGQVWQNGDDGLPTRAERPIGQFDFTYGKPVTGRLLDNAYSGWDGKAQIIWADRSLMLDVESDMAATVVYVPDGGDSFCFEPVPHINNALNLPEQSPNMPVVGPGECFKAHITFNARAARPTRGE
jgi:aldose 1-epimerase